MPARIEHSNFIFSVFFVRARCSSLDGRFAQNITEAHKLYRMQAIFTTISYDRMIMTRQQTYMRSRRVLTLLITHSDFRERALIELYANRGERPSCQSAMCAIIFWFSVIFAYFPKKKVVESNSNGGWKIVSVHIFNSIHISVWPIVLVN